MRGLFCCTVLSYEGINLSEVQEEVGASLSYVAYKCMGECSGISQFPGIGVWCHFLRILKDFCVFNWKWHTNNVPQTWFAEPCFSLPSSELSALRLPLQVCEGRRNTWRNLWCSECRGCSLLVQLAWHTHWGKSKNHDGTCHTSVCEQYYIWMPFEKCGVSSA